jgi:hypothetical protein
LILFQQTTLKTRPGAGFMTLIQSIMELTESRKRMALLVLLSFITLC